MWSFDLFSEGRPKVRSSIDVFGAISILISLTLIGITWSFAGELPPARQDLDRIAYAIDAAESSHGTNPAMWRPNLAGPQGPMQVSEKAARDVGGGDRFDVVQNRAIGRAYLALLYRRYGNWPDAISAYNWGLGNVDIWIRGGRPAQELVPAIAVYSHRVLSESGLCAGTVGGNRHCTVTYIRSLYRSTTAGLSIKQIAVPGLEQSGRPLARFITSGDPLPKLARSGEPLQSLKQSGRPLSR